MFDRNKSDFLDLFEAWAGYPAEALGMVSLGNLTPVYFSGQVTGTYSSYHYGPVHAVTNLSLYEVSHSSEAETLWIVENRAILTRIAAEKKEEYERLEKEYQESKILLEHNKQRTAALKEDLETTINMRVLEINKRFAVYMAAYQFQGEISWAQREDKNRRTHFDLYIKARKEGHRGTMEDVSVKARGGRVGKGVSGGEESLSSLLFALALLQNL
ncbi:hypothetical protein HMPREF3213_02896 [Heyndrickxia coagulans]|uniref:Uncharacterized protein n=1 Tax=Heyndrickxia coagulans TaxID=1398 RepID=A0A133KGQ9_HEYCO|nr:hypothetical protein HMPREF3213_02896 [Heyndrickxia coagulans]